MKKIPLSLQIVLGMLAGLVVGPLLGKDARSMGEIATLVIQIIKVVAAPLLFFAIVNAILKTEVTLRSGMRMMVIALFNSTLALVMGLTLSNYFQPGAHLQIAELQSFATSANPGALVAGQKIEFLKAFAGYIPTSFVQPFAENSIITLVLVALLIGFGLRKVRDDGEEETHIIENAVGTIYKILEVILGWIVHLTPLAVFGAVAKSTGEYGFAPLKGLSAYVGVGLFGLSLQILIVYGFWILVFARIPLKVFWAKAKEAIVYAIGTNSSLATLPLTLKTLDDLGVSKSAATLGACVGTNFNNDGIILYEAMAVLFVAQAHGIHLTLGGQVLAAFSCMVAAMGIAGVPEAGFISLALVLATVGLPVEILPLLLTVDWILARARSVTNVLSDMVVSIVLDTWTKKADLKQTAPKQTAPRQTSKVGLS